MYGYFFFIFVGFCLSAANPLVDDNLGVLKEESDFEAPEENNGETRSETDLTLRASVDAQSRAEVAADAAESAKRLVLTFGSLCRSADSLETKQRAAELAILNSEKAENFAAESKREAFAAVASSATFENPPKENLRSAADVVQNLNAQEEVSNRAERAVLAASRAAAAAVAARAAAIAAASRSAAAAAASKSGAAAAATRSSAAAAASRSAAAAAASRRSEKQNRDIWLDSHWDLGGGIVW